MFTKIAESDLNGKGVLGQSDVPGLTAEQMQRKVEEIVRDVAIVALNRLCDELGATGAESGASRLGAGQITGLPSAPNVQAALQALKNYADGLVIAVGAGDMARLTYDPGFRSRDVFAYADLIGERVTALQGQAAAQAEALSGKADASGVAEALLGKADVGHAHNTYAALSGAAFSGGVTVLSPAVGAGGVRNIHVVAQTPDATLGQDGDLCLVLE